MKKAPFKIERLVDFSKPTNRKNMEKAIATVRGQLGKEYPSLVGSEELFLRQKFASYNPAEKDQVVGLFQKSEENHADMAVKVAAETFGSWSLVDPVKRAGYLFKGAQVMRRRRLELAAWMVFEVGKSWVEADADVAEAIDFMEFYGREMLRYAGPQPLTKLPDEKNELKYIPLGVGIVIPPWNFPLAILVGMTTAAIVAGNTVVLKPSSDSPTIAAKFVEIMREVKLPKGVLNFLPGSGGVVGSALVGHPRTRFIAFTGSKEVGLGINVLAAQTQPGQIWIKRVIAEMGGKDAIVVDSGVNLDEAAAGVCTSAFGFQGQKCSACSRAIVVKGVYQKFIEKLIPKVRAISVGPTDSYENTMGPVINQAAMNTIMEYIEAGKTEGKLILGGTTAPGNGYFIRPTIFKDVHPKARISKEEIFGPVLAITKADDFDDAIAIANDTEYGLTGSVYTKSRNRIEKAKRLFHVGNLYFNRKCTGALVGAHPFGGFNMSGTDSKAGGRDYLMLFTQAKTISEKIR
ncbi:MAG: L-glutamate gamma-semialdehyde dehydrogenase [Candidatus Eiseniibacteriota bacterium]|nr:MAG: L-glutamate gamma-semialdehyde dehydrogenase [Candidatus Eisenbacteria bacterium]